MRSHHRLDAWKEAMKLVKMTYNVTAEFPQEEIYGLTRQMRRAAVSVPSNIAEGAARNSNRELLQFLIIARGSLSELETQVLIAKDLGYHDGEQLINQINITFSRLSGLINSVRNKARSAPNS